MTDKAPTPAERLAVATEGLLDLERQTAKEREYDARMRRDEERRRQDELNIGHRRADLFKIGFLAYATAAPLLAEAFSRKIPAEFWTEDTGLALISCPCGETPSAEKGVATWCGTSDWVEEDRERDPERDGCGRAYLYDGVAVRVAFSPAPQATAA